MRFTVAWANTISENRILKIIVALLATLLILLSFVTITLSGRRPFVIERGCTTQAITAASELHSIKELENFLKETLPKRFDSDVPEEPAYFSAEEFAFRKTEQADLEKKSMSQLIVIRKTPKISGSSAFVEADRLISVGNIRTALRTPLTVELGSVDRTTANPYGLILKRIVAVKDTEEIND